MRLSEYKAPLVVLSAGTLGLGLFCCVTAIALQNPQRALQVTVEPLNLIDVAIANLATIGALTEQALIEYVPTPTNKALPTITATYPTPTVLRSHTPVVAVSPKPLNPTRTRRPQPIPTSTVPPTWTRTPLSPNTPTRHPTATFTHIPSQTNTAVPSSTTTEIPLLTDTSTPVLLTDTPLPPATDTATSEVPTNTLAPPAGVTPTLEFPVETISSP